jgi:hypothetical protein
VQAIDSFILLYHQFDITVLYSQTYQTTRGSPRHQTLYFKYGVSVADTPATAAVDTIADTPAVVNTLLAVFTTAGVYDIILATPVVDMMVVTEPMVPHFVLGH